MILARTYGLFVGLTLGIVWMWLGFGAALLTGALGLVGWLVGAALANLVAGNLTFNDLWNGVLGRGRAET